jgi:hypothetical protein
MHLLVVAHCKEQAAGTERDGAHDGLEIELPQQRL